MAFTIDNTERVAQSLNKPKYQYAALTYPKKTELGSSLLDSHYMVFYININENSSYYTNRKDASIPRSYYIQPQTGTKQLSNEFSDPINKWDNVPTYIQNMQESTTNLLGLFDSSNYKGVYKRTSTAITLHIPSDSISFVSKPNWEDVSVTELGGDILKYIQQGTDLNSPRTPSALKSAIDLQNVFKVGALAGKALGGQIDQAQGAIDQYNKYAEKKGLPPLAYSALQKGTIGAIAALNGSQLLNNLAKTDLFVRSAGFAVNPQIMVLYKDIGLRQFSFSFIFTPHNDSEAENVREIIKLFRLHAHPESTGTSGRFHIAPSTFDIEFFYGRKDIANRGGKENTNIPKISTCCMTGISVDYSPYGWSTYTDGMPVQTHLTMHFKEMEVMTKELIEKGF